MKQVTPRPLAARATLPWLLVVRADIVSLARGESVLSLSRVSERRGSAELVSLLGRKVRAELVAPVTRKG
jgi:hypothetical protein